LVNNTDYTPERGHLVWLNFNPQAGHEQAGRRPALVISPEAYNRKVGLALFCPVTTNEKGYPFEVKIPEESKINGVILSDHVKNLDWKIRRAEFICNVSQNTLREVLEKLNVLIGI
jgi:mRNA interferase MazF